MFVELSHPISPDMPVFPGLPTDEFHPYTRMSRGQESNTTMVHHFLHNGTHVDAPFHFYDQGIPIDQVPLEKFIYTKPVLLQKNLGKGEMWQVQDLKAVGAALYDADLLCLSTGYHARRKDAAVYSDDFPAISLETACFLRVELPLLKAVAIDTLSIESCVVGPQTDFQVHKTLLAGDLYPERPLLIYEDVNFAPILDRPPVRVFAFPLRFVGLDGSPVNMVAEVV
jgi:kynurenine formamidase